jgi:hypothetical protein
VVRASLLLAKQVALITNTAKARKRITFDTSS